MKAKYAIRALLVMAGSDKKMFSSKFIAASGDIPQKFLDNILQELRHYGVVDSKRGVFGGYSLAKVPEEIMIGEIVRKIDGPLAPIRCASITAYQRCEDCPDENACAIRKVMAEVRNAIADVLDHKSVADLVRDGSC